MVDLIKGINKHFKPHFVSSLSCLCQVLQPFSYFFNLQADQVSA